LGLALVARMAELHGGSVAVESEVGQGSRFTVSLPWRREDAAPTSIPIWEGREQVTQATGGEREAAPAAADKLAAGSTALHLGAPDSLVLLAEDNEANIHALRGFLEHQGYRLIVAHTGREAMELAKSDRPDIILMDIQMPDMDGLEAIRSLRADADMRQIPIIAVTALVLPGDRERCLAAGANDFVSKPISIDDLTNAISVQLQAQMIDGAVA
jgi:CheY-like chemotaxis protein